MATLFPVTYHIVCLDYVIMHLVLVNESLMAVIIDYHCIYPVLNLLLTKNHAEAIELQLGVLLLLTSMH